MYRVLVLVLFAAAKVFALDPSEAEKTPTAVKSEKKQKTKKKWPTVSEVVGPTGSFRTSYFDKDKDFSEKKGYFDSSFWLSLRPAPKQGYQLYIESNIQWHDIGRTKTSYLDFRELYFEKSAGSFDFKIGRQITVWGRADKINPTDNLSVRNLTRLLTEDEEQRSGLTAIQSIYNFSDYRLILISQPEWRETQLPIPPQAEGVSIRTITPKSTNGQYGLKIDRTGGDIDYSLSYYNGLDKTPDLNLLYFGPLGLDLGLQYNHVGSAGFDMATTIGSVGLRLEAAYTKTQDTDGTDPFVKNSFWFAVLGVEKSFFENLNINIQYLYRGIENWQDPDAIADPLLATLARAEQLYSNQQQKTQHGFSGRIQYKAMNDALTLEGTYLRWQQKGDSFFRPKIIYAFSDHLKGIVGGEIYYGPLDSYLGEFKSLSGGFAEVRYEF